MVVLNLESPVLLETFSTPVPIRSFSVAEYEAMGRAGILSADDNVELLEGRISPKMTKNPPHNFILDELYEALRSRVPAGYFIKNQGVVATADSQPEPDLAVLRGVRKDLEFRHPQPDEVALIVEVSDASLARDRYKKRIYARAGIRTYWIVNVNERYVEVYTDPIASEDAQYQSGIRYTPSDIIEVELDAGVSISVPVSEFLSPS